ncbi:MAG: hypothetical protein ACI90V_003531, partial [Bacillariaceae sp.]
ERKNKNSTNKTTRLYDCIDDNTQHYAVVMTSFNNTERCLSSKLGLY